MDKRTKIIINLNPFAVGLLVYYGTRSIWMSLVALIISAQIAAAKHSD